MKKGWRWKKRLLKRGGIRLAAFAAAALMALSATPAQAVAETGMPAGQNAPTEHVVAVVIDDFGNRMKGTAEMLRLPIPITAAVMPFLPTSQADAEAAHAAGREVIVHLPMEPVRGKASWLGPRAIMTALPDEEIRLRTEAAIADVPHAVGMNNHMGSRATADERVMRIVLQVCKEHGLFFLDSRTSYKTVVPKLAREMGVPLLQNDLFLDDVYTDRHVAGQMLLLKARAQKHDRTVVIGHVGPPGLITSGQLAAAAPSLRQASVRFVKLSELLSPPSPYLMPGAELPGSASLESEPGSKTPVESPTSR
ncbi:divergent polysaccharide deacetylase family protein [Cohnella sp. GCM10012308]|uniref:divergent polysaccharide deacetylase family protein n=1 Tax=Cohnella sp. GCM10012308 TaxID=3317329 RepID=UPI0036173D07